MAMTSVTVKRLSFIMCVILLAGGGALLLTHSKSASANKPAETILKGASGLPLPRFVSLKFDKVNVRRGPSVKHQVAWVFARKGLPVEIIAEFEHWRRVRDSEGEEGWVYFSLLTGKRTVLVAPWRKKQRIELYAQTGGNGKTVAMVEAGALGTVKNCSGKWCRFASSGIEGWISQELLWGIYPGEHLK
jgi:SH3-like domain-containing protein